MSSISAFEHLPTRRASVCMEIRIWMTKMKKIDARTIRKFDNL